jgi:hypothetical protein
MSKQDFVRRAQTVATIAAGLRAELDALIEVYGARDYGGGDAARAIVQGGEMAAAFDIFIAGQYRI